MEGLFQVLTEDGRARTKVEPPLSSADLRKLYSLMAATRAADLAWFVLGFTVMHDEGFAAFAERFVDADGFRIRYLEAGRGEPSR